MQIDPKFSTIRSREVLSKTVASKIEDAIRGRILKNGDRLASELELAAQFDVSRTVIREAVRMLSAKGILDVRKGKGIFVHGYSVESVTGPLHSYLQFSAPESYGLDVIRARQVIEPAIAYLAATAHNEEDAAKLRKDLEDLKRSSPDDHELLADLDMEFHMDIARATHNAIIPLILEPIHLLMPAVKMAIYGVVQDARDSAVDNHGRILEGILGRDPEKAQRAMWEHLQVAEEHGRRALGGDHHSGMKV